MRAVLCFVFHAYLHGKALMDVQRQSSVYIRVQGRSPVQLG